MELLARFCDVPGIFSKGFQFVRGSYMDLKLLLQN